MNPSKPPKDPLSLVPIEGAVGVALVDEHPFASDNVAASGTVNQVLGVIGKQGHMLVLHRHNTSEDLQEHDERTVA